MKKFVIFALIAVAMLCMFVGCSDTKLIVKFHDTNETYQDLTIPVSFSNNTLDLIYNALNGNSGFIKSVLDENQLAYAIAIQDGAEAALTFNGVECVLDESFSIGVDGNVLGLSITFNYDSSKFTQPK